MTSLYSNRNHNFCQSNRNLRCFQLILLVITAKAILSTVMLDNWEILPAWWLWRPRGTKGCHLEETDGFGFETGVKGWRVRVGYEAEWLRYHSSYSIFITVIPPHTDICDLWATGCQPRSGWVCVVGLMRFDGSLGSELGVWMSEGVWEESWNTCMDVIMCVL